MTPAVPPDQRRQANLGRLCSELDAYAVAHGLSAPGPCSAAAASLSDRLLLSNSSTADAFASICRTGQLLSTSRAAALRGDPLPASCTEVILGTQDSVFFYLGPFRYPDTACGLLYAADLEKACAGTGVATPFDSGGVLHHFRRADPAEPAREFLSRHELPVPGHRRYLARTLDVLFASPDDYLDRRAPLRPGAIGLEGGDARRWTHEVRVPDFVWLRSAHLRAVFVPVGRAAPDPDIVSLLIWCEENRVDQVPYPVEREPDFPALQHACLRYLHDRLR